MVGLIAHEWIAPHGGAENAAEAMASAFPTADVRTLWNDAPDRFAGHRVQESWLSRTTLRQHKAAALPLMSSTWANVDVRAYDFVLSSSHIFAHHVGAKRGASDVPMFSYVHTPARMIWAPEQDPRGAGLLVRTVAPLLKRLDLQHIRETTQYAANSRFIQRRIEQVWHQSARVIYPPVDVRSIRARETELSAEEELILSSIPADFVLGASRFVEYKRLDLVLAAAQDRPVVLAGSGPLENELKRRASEMGIHATVVRRPSDALLRELFYRAAVFVFPAVEDFGIMPVEAMAAGTPVVVYGVGGARESVELLNGGVIVDSLDVAVLRGAIDHAAAIDMSGVPDRAERMFSRERFVAETSDWVGARYEAGSQ